MTLGATARRRWLGREILAGVVLVVAIGTGAIARADDAADARRHAQRASSLAASGKCRQAVAEFDKALAILRDPALLFNRGECHRKLGDAEAALDDYKQFLTDLPKAPNRAEVEKRIAELNRKLSGAGTEATPPPAAAPARRPSRDAQASSDGDATPSRSRPAAKPPVAETEAVKPREVDLSPSSASDGAPSADQGSAAGVRLSKLSESSDSANGGAEGSITSRPWFWVAVAAVAVGAGVGVFFALNRDGTSVPSSALGNYKF